IFTKEKIVEIERTKVLPGEGVNTTYFSPGPRENKVPAAGFHFLMSTRLLKSKGVKNFADAARIIRKKFKNVRFELIGFFEKSHPDTILEEELDKWQKEGLVSYKGFVRDVRPFLQTADCFVFPSYYNEGIPRSLMEAASMELPIITSFNRGCKEVVQDHVNGFLCRQNDPFDLAEKMAIMINSPLEERKRMGSQGRSLVMERFNVEKVIHEYERILKDL
ncbi:MAG: glycosyltransferase, partial [Chitinophagales bacterium]